MAAVWLNQGTGSCVGSRVLVQEGIANAFPVRLRDDMEPLRVVRSLDKAVNLDAMVVPAQLDRI